MVLMGPSGASLPLRAISTMRAMMKKIHALTLLTTLTLLPLSNSFAAWTELGSNEAMVVYVDTDTINRSGEKAQILSMLDFKKPGVNPQTKEPVSSMVGINEYNCPTVSYRPIEYKEFAGNKGSGKMVSDNKTPKSEYEPVVSESWTAGVFNVVCQRK